MPGQFVANVLTNAARASKLSLDHEPHAPDLLHIYVRHLTSIDDALDTFFNGRTNWHEEHKRFETYTESHGLFWFWLEQEKVVMIISCFMQ